MGKTSIVLRFCHCTYNPSNNPTVGASFLTKSMYFIFLFFGTYFEKFSISRRLLGGQRIKLQIWDTAGQERFRSLVQLKFLIIFP